MQTRSRPPVVPPEPPVDLPETETKQTVSRLSRWKRWLNFGLALVVMGLAFLYISKDGTFYSAIPGGRKLLFVLALAAGAVLVGARLWLGYGREGLTKATVGVLRSARTREMAPVGAVFLLALVVRLWGINFGMPYLEHVDEWNVAERALHIVQTGNFDPLDYRHPGLADNDRQAFTYPTLTTYLETGVFSLRFLQGVAAGQYDGTSMLSNPLVKADFYLWGRGLVALLGAGTVLLVYVLGRRVYGRGAGLVAALFLAFFYLHALNSHWLTTDVPSGFMALLPFWWILTIAEGSEKRRDYLLAGLLAGLAVATKYNNALIVAPLLAAHLLGRPARRWLSLNLPLALGAVLAGFFVGAPFIFFHLPEVLTDLAAIINHYQNTGHPGYEANDNWLQYVNFMLQENAAVVWLGLGGVVMAALRHSRRDLVLLSFPLLTYLQLSSYKVNFTRNLMPVIPFLCLFAGMFLVQGFNWLWNRRPALVARLPAWTHSAALSVLAILAVLSPALAIASYDSYNALPTNRARATTWIEQNLPRGAKLWLEPFSTDLLPRSEYRLEGGTGALAHPPEWYAANGFHYVVLSEAYNKESVESGNESVRAQYRALLEGPYPPGFSPVADFKKNPVDRPGARILVLSTGLPLLTTEAEAAKVAQPLSLNFDNRLELIGARFAGKASAGSEVMVAFFWKTLRPLSSGQDYTTFLHLLNGQGQTVAQLDLAPFSGTRPTSTWQAGEVSRDNYPLVLPPNLAPGRYTLTMGLYLPPNGPRLNLTNGQNEAEIGTLEVMGK